VKKEEKESMSVYNSCASFYHDYRTKLYPKGWFFNEHLEMPATLELLGNIKDKKVLDYGCGTGLYLPILKKKGARVNGFDISKEMLTIARKNHPDVDLREGSGYSIPFKEQFDLIVASLVVHYMKDWDRMFKEMNRVLKKGGIVVFSTGNSVYEMNKNVVLKGKKYKVLGIKDYFKEEVFYSSWTNPYNNKKIRVPVYHKTYETIIKTILRNGFEIIDYKDCFPTKRSKKLFPKNYAQYSKMPMFMVFKVRKK
jgi:ubiquinone/menaquinone biosynthesis C-methylase UbiE